MLGIRTSTAEFLLLLSVAAPLSAAGPDYFPLQVGNSWVYRAAQARTNRVQTISVDAIESVDGRDYYRVQFFERTVYVRPLADGSLVAYDRNMKQEQPWLPFGLAEGQRTQTEFDNCSRSVMVRSKSASLKTTLGDFNNALLLAYEPNCADAGVASQYFLPYIGLLQQESATIAGPLKYELVYSRTGFTNVDAKEVGFTMALDSQTYDRVGNPEMFVRLTLRSTNTNPVPLTFPSGQSFDLKIYNDRGGIVYVWSADKIFTLAIRNAQLGPGERSWALTAPIAQLPAGRYAAEGYLTTQPRMYSAVVQFEVR